MEKSQISTVESLDRENENCKFLIKFVFIRSNN